MDEACAVVSCWWPRAPGVIQNAVLASRKLPSMTNIRAMTIQNVDRFSVLTTRKLYPLPAQTPYLYPDLMTLADQLQVPPRTMRLVQSPSSQGEPSTGVSTL